MTPNKTILSNSIEVVPAFKNEWQFRFPRLDAKVNDTFDEALEEFDVGNLQKAESTLRHLVKEFPEFIDAYNHLAMILDETRRQGEARAIWETAIQIGRIAIPYDFKINRHTLPWGILENRQFLRACHFWGLQLLREENDVEALAVFREILSMNPSDNQGVRALAIDCYFRLGKPTEVLSICKYYPDDTMEEVLYGGALALFRLNREKEAHKALRKAIQILPNVANELLKKNHRPPKDLNPWYATHGGNDQAFYYWKYQGQHWINTNGAIEFLASVYKESSSR